MGEGLALAIRYAPALLGAVTSFFGVKAFHDKIRDDVPSLFSSDDMAINPSKLEMSDDYDTTKKSFPVFAYDDKKVNNVLDSSSKINDYVLNQLSSIGKSSVSQSFSDLKMDALSIDLSDLKDIDNSNDDVSSGENLLDLLKSNNKELIKTLNTDAIKFLQVLGVISNSITALSVSNALAGAKIVDEIKALREAVSLLPLTIMAQSKENTAVLSNVISNGFDRLSSSVSKNVPVVNVTNDVPVPSVENNIDIQSLVDVLNDKLGIVAQAKELEKENYEYMKSPQSYHLVDEDLPNLAPRDVIALSEAVKAHLNSQEASLTAEDVGVDDYDIDFGDSIMKLFNFVGISNDINKMGGNE